MIEEDVGKGSKISRSRQFLIEEPYASRKLDEIAIRGINEGRETFEQTLKDCPLAIEIFEGAIIEKGEKRNVSFFMKVSRETPDAYAAIFYMVPASCDDFEKLPLRIFIPRSRSLIVRDISV